MFLCVSSWSDQLVTLLFCTDSVLILYCLFTQTWLYEADSWYHIIPFSLGLIVYSKQLYGDEPHLDYIYILMIWLNDTNTIAYFIW